MNITTNIRAEFSWMYILASYTFLEDFGQFKEFGKLKYGANNW